jgi:hypothetical protein
MKIAYLALLLFSASLMAQQSPVSSPPLCGLKNVEIQVKLLSPLNSATASQGDAFTTVVQSPEQFTGGTIEGVVKSVTKAAKGFGKGKPSMEFEFTNLSINGRVCRINGELEEVTNSKGVAKVDEEGKAVGHTSNKKRIGSTIGGAGIGALAGAAAGGGLGAIIGAAAGGTAGFLVSSKVTAVGTDIQFLPGSVFTLKVSDFKSGMNGR